MIVQLNLSALRETRWYDYAIRFVLGGAMTVIAGLIAARFGPVVGGLLWAFPAIFPASATLIEKHGRERKEKAGLAGARRGKLDRECRPRPLLRNADTDKPKLAIALLCPGSRVAQSSGPLRFTAPPANQRPPTLRLRIPQHRSDRTA